MGFKLRSFGFFVFAGIVTVSTCLADPIGRSNENILTDTPNNVGGKAGGEVPVPVAGTQTLEYVTIGNAKIPKNEVTDVGDIDNNGYSDYIVAKPLAQNKAGSIRLHLMNENNTFLYSREIIPGNWGFKSPALMPGDLFGSAVLKLPHGNKELPCQIAVGAPGDAGGRGAVYLLKLSDRGGIIGSQKTSADTDQSLAKQHDEKEGFGSEIKAIADLNGDEGLELAVKSLSGSTTLLFMKSTGEVQVGLKMHGEDNIQLMKLTDGPVIATERTLLDVSVLADRAGFAAQCFFNETSCGCGLKDAEKGSASCMDVIGTESGTGKTLCKLRDCEASYQCSCDGNEFCNRVEIMSTAFVSDGPARDGNVYCSKTSSSEMRNVVLVGVPIPTPAVLPENLPFNSTHCSCSRKSDVQGPSQCLDFLRVISNVAVLCTSRICRERSDDYVCDGLGLFYCSRAYAKTTRYVNDGDSRESKVQYCHADTHTVEILTRIQ